MPTQTHAVLQQVTQRIRERSGPSRAAYLAQLEQAAAAGPNRESMSCSNLAHGIAACAADTKEQLTTDSTTNIAIVSAYNDMLSAHQPYARYPDLIKRYAIEVGAVAQFAGGVPAMCDGVTQGRAGMDLSLFSRDVIAMSTAIALSHDMFDAVVCLGICDKIVPGLMIGALTFGHLPTVFIPAGPMHSGLPNKDKARVREDFANGTVGRDELIAAETASYHSPGTCTFFGTANSNQMLMEFMGLQLPGSSFVNPDDEMRDQLTRVATLRAAAITKQGNEFTPIGHIVDEGAIVNGMIGLLATGGSTNHTLHLVAMAAAAGITINWQDFADLGKVVPLLAQVYPNGSADVNAFHAAGGTTFLINQLLSAGLLNQDVTTILGHGLDRFAVTPTATATGIEWRAAAEHSADRAIVREASDPFQADGGVRLLSGNLGRAVVKVSAVAPEQRCISAPARIFHSQEAFSAAFDAGELNQDLVAVVRFQGPSANGMPELHKLSPYLGSLQNQGFRVALLTDGRMSGASGKVLAAIHVTPEACQNGAIAKLRDGDHVTIDADQGLLHTDADLSTRDAAVADLSANELGTGRELFKLFRRNVGAAEQGASVFERS